MAQSTHVVEMRMRAEDGINTRGVNAGGEYIVDQFASAFAKSSEGTYPRFNQHVRATERKEQDIFLYHDSVCGQKVTGQDLLHLLLGFTREDLIRSS